MPSQSEVSIKSVLYCLAGHLVRLFIWLDLLLNFLFLANDLRGECHNFRRLIITIGPPSIARSRIFIGRGLLLWRTKYFDDSHLFARNCFILRWPYIALNCEICYFHKSLARAAIAIVLRPIVFTEPTFSDISWNEYRWRAGVRCVFFAFQMCGAIWINDFRVCPCGRRRPTPRPIVNVMIDLINIFRWRSARAY